MLLLAGACTVSGPSSLPQMQAGAGIAIDGGTISVDPKTAHAADSDALGGVAASSYQTTAAADGKYLGLSSTAANAAKLGGTPAASYAVKDSGGNIDLGGGRVLITSATNQTTTFGLFCGQTSVTYSGSISVSSGMSTTSGYQAAKLLCEQVSACTSLSHMCRPDEMVMSLQLGAIDFSSMSDDNIVWVAAGVSSEASAGLVNDCGAFTSNSSSQLAGVFDLKAGGANAGVPQIKQCSLNYAIACCL
ncbi:MAG TPA: hypothetical protein VLW85_21585 [Myxococcales bacterium]|nr:hypothetical protein [Myxococcales bacterium]